MIALLKQFRLYIPVVLMAAIFMLTGHFCFANASANVPHSDIQQSHHSGIAEDNFKACCQQNHSENFNNSVVINKYDSLTTSNLLGHISTPPYTTSLISSGQPIPNPNISPHQFKEKSFRILLC